MLCGETEGDACRSVQPAADVEQRRGLRGRGEIGRTQATRRNGLGAVGMPMTTDGTTEFASENTSSFCSV